MRLHTKIQFCERHAGWFAGLPRYRKIECMVEGGPGGWTPGCEGGECRCWPGTDIFDPAYCTDELDLDWTKVAVHA